LGTFGGGWGYAYDINNVGQITGSANRPNGPQHAFRYQNGVMTDLGVLAGTTASQGLAINDLGQVVGRSFYTTGTGVEVNSAFLYSGSTMVNLGYGQAFGINNAGDVVGCDGSHAFIYQNGTMIDLNTLIAPGSGWTLSAAFAINDAGQIVGQGSFNGNKAFLLTPIPEPATVSLLAVGLGAMAMRRRRGR
jgi:probable HAF family extracellular repeat protein